MLTPGGALALGLVAGANAKVSDGSAETVLVVETSAAVPHGAAWIEAGHSETGMLKGTGATLTVGRA